MRKNDRIVLLAATVVAVVALVGIYLLGRGSADGAGGQTASHSAGGTVAGGSAAGKGSYYATETRHVEEFPFDPNTADSTQLLRLGLQPWQVRNIYKYRARGGVYRKKEDFARLYGLTVKDYRRLEPYIRISADYLPAATLVGERPRYERDTVTYPVKLTETEHVVLNTADTNQLKRVPGIGSYYAKEIVRHGRWLGGYVSVNQLDEIDQFPQEAKKYFVIRDPQPRKVNINSLDDLRFSPDFTDEAIRRLQPYVEY